MYIFLILWLIFLFVYIIFNIYGMIQVMAKRFRGDAVGKVVPIYLLVIFTIIFFSLFLISTLDWGRPLSEILKIR